MGLRVSIFGVGTDLVNVEFWRKVIDDPTTSVIEGTFSESEIDDIFSGPVPPEQRFATRFAAKEAFLKALGGGRIDQEPLRQRLNLKEIVLKKDAWGRPTLALYGDAQRVLELLNINACHVSLSHEEIYAVATVILET